VTWRAALTRRYREAANPLHTERRIELLVLSLFLLLILQLAYGAFRLAVLSTPEAVLPAADSLQVLTSLSLDTVTSEQSSEIRDRPLLWPDRRPIAGIALETAPSEVNAEELKELQDIELRGVFGSGDAAGIIVLVKNNPRRIRLAEEVDGWKLESVGVNEAVFAAGSRRAKLVLQNQPIKPVGRSTIKSERGR